MTVPLLHPELPAPAGPAARHRLARSARAWFVASALGQLLFLAFILLFYYRLTLGGDLAGWNAKPLITGHVPGDTPGNRQFALHVLLAAPMTAAGLVQLLPAVRRRWPAVHRWSGRLFLLAALLLSVGGLWLTWVRGSHLTLAGAIAISGDALLIVWFGTMAWICARRREFAAHRRWALRAFIAASAVWFMRVGYMAWGLATGGAGIGPAMAGPFDLAWAFGTYLLPLAVLELYLRAETGPLGLQRTVAVGLWGAAAVILAGSIGAWMIMWSPYL
jgi:hypothetical protein